MQAAIDSGQNQIIINTNLKLGLPMENINKIAGPMVEAWACETFNAVMEDGANKYSLINVEAQQRLGMADVILQFKKKHKVYSTKNNKTGLVDGIMEVVAHNAYDLKLLSSPDISYNPALGTGQIQIRDIHYVTLTERSTWEFCQLLDKKFINSRNGFKQWLTLAIKNGWIKTDE